MNNMSATIIAKSDQINAADLIGTPRTVTVKEVRIKAGEDQPVTILIEGDNKGFRPCKGVRRLIVRVWGPDASKYIGQSLTLFCDKSVTWAGKEEGGIRVSHMTGLNEKIVEYMRTSRAGTKAYEILPLAIKAAPARQTADQWAAEQAAAAQNAVDLDDLSNIMATGEKAMAKLEKQSPELWADVNQAYATRRAQIEGEGRGTEDMGEAFTDATDLNDWEA